MSRFNLRKKQRISYYEVEEPNLDEYVFCSKCKDYVYEYCSIHGALLVIPDNKVPKKTNFPSFVPRAALTIPDVFLHLAPSTIPGAGLGVFTTLTLPSNVRFGPYRGKITQNADSDYCWQIYDKNNKPFHMVDGSEANNSNWMRYVNCSRHWCEQNMVAFQYQGQIYYRTIRIIPRFTELMVFYGVEFAKKLCIDVRRYIKPITPPKIVEPLSNTDRHVDKNTKNLLYVENKNIKANNEKNTPSFKKAKYNKDIENIEKTETDKNKTNSNKKVNNYKNDDVIKTNVVKKTQEKDKNKDRSCKKVKNTKVDDVVRNVMEDTEEFPKNKTSLCEKVIYNKTDDIMRPNEVEHLNKNGPNSSKNLDDVINNNLLKKTEEIHKDSTNINDNIKNNESHENADFKIETNNKNTDILTNKSSKSSSIDDNNNTFDCDKCEYKDQERLKTFHLSMHLRESIGLEVFSCNICSYKCPNKKILDKHRKFHNSVRCKTCNKYFALKQELDVHVRYKNFTQRSNVNDRIRTHTGERPFTCDMCDKKFTQISSLNVHIRTHTGERPFTCDMCDKKFTQINNLNVHIRTHTGERPFTCDMCDKKFTQINSLNVHIRTHTGERPFTCDICDKKFINKSHLNVHIRTHTGERPFTCDICDKKFTRISSLKVHIRTHTGERPFTCDICDKKFINKSHLNVHIRTHTGERPFTCDMCDKKFIEKSHLNVHIRTHTGERPFTCDICDKKFINKSNLNVHIRTHTGKRPFTCDMCDKKFTQKSDLNKHIKTHLGKLS